MTWLDEEKSTPHTHIKNGLNLSAEFLKWNHPVDYIDSSNILNNKYFAVHANK